jgi:hypothetical protein
MAQEALVELIATHAGMITGSAGKPQKVNRAAPNAPSVIYDAVAKCRNQSSSPIPVRCQGMAVTASALPNCLTRRGQHFFETAPEPGDDKPPR